MNMEFKNLFLWMKILKYAHAPVLPLLKRKSGPGKKKYIAFCNFYSMDDNANANAGSSS